MHDALTPASRQVLSRSVRLVGPSDVPVTLGRIVEVQGKNNEIFSVRVDCGGGWVFPFRYSPNEGAWVSEDGDGFDIEFL